ncbi:Mo25-like protein [Microstroma glucosiphilum]|uniref:Mo25-like protein n=1 Tax=Pseudomicrostroma glucosiphilum TaxID=1684307 RepID=A0A316UD25_9BASI|nr:Mo25-like protein [Pseudomicrostroma glucosiphilum]PWN23099.1 Mo25-like protein [Pseudomicrostroma glucosiphilum]
MNFIFKSKSRTPAELVKNIRDAIRRLESSSASQEAQRKCSEDVSKNLSQMKAILYGDGENEPQAEQVAQLAQEVYNQDVLQLLVLNIWRFDFEAKKDVAQIFNNLLRRQIGSRWPTVEYLTTKPDVIFSTLKGYENQDVALNTGMILREMLRHEPLAKILLYAERFYAFPDYIEKTTFGVSCDAFANFKETLTKHKAMVAEYLEKNYDRFFTMYDGLLQSPNYVTKRQSLKLLGEILLDRTNFNVMTRYISSEENLKLMMNLLRDKSKNIQFEAFHVFKVFVANPKKPAVIENILRRNRDRLVQFLSNFHNDKDDEQFTDEKSYLISLLQQQPDANKVA